MSYIILLDERINVPSPSSNRTYSVNQSTDLAATIERIASSFLSDMNGTNRYMNELHIICHGLSQGLQLGNHFINHNSVTLFRPIANLFGNVFIHGCSAAFIYPGGCNGILLCSRMAIITNAYVWASDATQYLINGGSITNVSGQSTIMNWNGSVGTWNTNGRLIRLRNYSLPTYDS